ncbi:hypothetical protein [Nocardia sp. NPDC051570]|uniref:hypothetical protein n=1 Tax=Nocardia sp. NPDC051570 TaxID=3364324 RepID=UPI0037B0195F
MTSQPDHSHEPESIRQWLCAIESEAGPAWRVRREPGPPYGWSLFDDNGAAVCSGSLDKIDQWLRHRRTRAEDH